MIVMRIKYGCLWIALIALSIIPTALHAQALSLKIELDKQEFVEGEPIYAMTTMENLSDQIQNCARFNVESGWLKYTVISPNGEAIEYSGITVSYVFGTELFRPLESHASIQYILSLMMHYYNFFNSNAGHPIDIAARMLPGTYQVQTYYDNDSISVASNILKFTVVAAKGEDAEVLELLKPKFKLSYLGKKNYEEQAAFFQVLADKYKKSSFYPLIRQYLAMCLHGKGDTTEALTMVKDLIKEYPNTGLVMKAFEWFRLKDQERKEFVEEMNRIAPNSRFVKYWKDSTLKSIMHFK